MAPSPPSREARERLHRRAWRQTEAARFSILLVSLLCSIAALLLVEPVARSRVLVHASISLPPLVGLWVASRNAALIAASAAAVALATGLGVVGHDLDDPTWILLAIGARVAMMLLVMAWVVREVGRERFVSQDTLLAGIAIYVSLGFVFALLSLMVAIVEPGSYASTTSAVALRQPGQHALQVFPTILYFSFCTLTTVGYGDIAPVGEGVRMLAMIEAVVGQLFPAIFIARLVGLHIAQRGTRAPG